MITDPIITVLIDIGMPRNPIVPKVQVIAKISGRKTRKPFVNDRSSNANNTKMIAAATSVVNTMSSRINLNSSIISGAIPVILYSTPAGFVIASTSFCIISVASLTFSSLNPAIGLA